MIRAGHRPFGPGRVAAFRPAAAKRLNLMLIQGQRPRDQPILYALPCPMAWPDGWFPSVARVHRTSPAQANAKSGPSFGPELLLPVWAKLASLRSAPLGASISLATLGCQ